MWVPVDLYVGIDLRGRRKNEVPRVVGDRIGRRHRSVTLELWFLTVIIDFCHVSVLAHKHD